MVREALRKSIRYLFISFVVLIPNLLLAADLYVNQDHTCCTDPGQQICLQHTLGTVERPFCDIQSAADIVNPGDVVNIAEGLYRQSNSITFRRSGTPENPITFKADGEVWITGAFPIENASSAFTPTPGYSNVYEINFDNLPSEFNPDYSGIVQLDGTVEWRGYRAGTFDGTLSMNQAQWKNSITEVNQTVYSFYVDENASKLYFHSRDGTAPDETDLLQITKKYYGRILTLGSGVHDLIIDGLNRIYAGNYYYGGVKRITFRNFESIGNGISIGLSSLVLGEPAEDLKVENCYLHDGLHGTTGQNSGGIHIFKHVKGVQVLNCKVEKFWNNIQWDGGEDIFFDRVISTNCPNHGMNGRHSKDFTATNMIITRAQDAFYLRGDIRFTVMNSLFGAITLQSNPEDGCIPPNNIYMRNNITGGYRKLSTGTCSDFSYSDLNLDTDYNYIFPVGEPDESMWDQTGNFKIYCSLVSCDFGSWQAMGYDLNSNLANDPTSQVFADWRNEDFRLVEGTWAIDNGLTVPVPYDMNSNIRPAGAGIDIGPYEFGATGGGEGPGPTEPPTGPIEPPTPPEDPENPDEPEKPEDPEQPGDTGDCSIKGSCTDQCPNDPYKLSPGICGCGILDTDYDLDGEYDCHEDPLPKPRKRKRPGKIRTELFNSDMLIIAEPHTDLDMYRFKIRGKSVDENGKKTRYKDILDQSTNAFIKPLACGKYRLNYRLYTERTRTSRSGRTIIRKKPRSRWSRPTKIKVCQ